MYKYVISVFLFSLIISCTTEDQEAIDGVIEIIELFEDDEADEDGVTAGTNSSGEESNLVVIASNGNELQTVTGFGEVVTINSENKTDLVLAGSNNSVFVETDLGELSVSGSNNLLSFSPNTSVEVCTVGGSDNTAQKDESVFLNCEVNGSGNMGF